jgi:sulfate-transporting ATPase
MADNTIIFSMVGVSKTIPPSKQILKDIYLSFFYGAKIGIIGANGSGKSTLLRIIAGMDENYQGKIEKSKDYSTGMLEQEPKLDESKTVIEIIRYGIKEIFDLLDVFNAIS